MKGRIKVTVVVLLMCAAFIYLIVIGLNEGSMYYLEVSEFNAKLPALSSEKVRVNGMVKKGTYDFDSKEQVLSFTLKDTKGPETVNVVFKGPPPDLVQDDGITVVAEGRYDKSREVFVSTKLLVKCPSKYEKEGGKV
jgi:cytochrome c-type biogenesis protein CcmE